MSKSHLRTTGLSTFLILFNVTLLGGCAIQREEPGISIQDVQEYSFIVVGKTTKSDLFEKLGLPNQTALSSAGIETLTWGGSSRIADLQNYIPFVGGLLSGATTKYHALNVVVNRKGVVLDFNFIKGLHKQQPKI